MMKKLFALLMTLMMLCCAAFAETAVDYTGYWVLTSMDYAGVVIDPAQLGLTAYMELYGDGTCLMVMADEAQAGTWVATENGIDTTDAEGVVDPFTYVDGTLVLEQDGTKLIFTPEVYTVPLTGLTVADFNGDWSFAYLEYLGAAYAAEEVGMTLDVHLEDGAGHIVMTYEGGAEAYDLTCMVEEAPDFGTVLYAIYLDETGAETDAGMVLFLFDNDELVWYSIDESDNELYYCFQRVTAE